MSDFANATEAASLAVQFDQAGQTEKAVECYRTAARLLDRIRDRFPPDKQLELRNKVREYHERATVLCEQKGRLFSFSVLNLCGNFLIVGHDS